MVLRHMYVLRRVRKGQHNTMFSYTPSEGGLWYPDLSGSTTNKTTFYM